MERVASAAWAGWAGYWLLAGLLPWLHTKYFATSVILAGIGAWQAWRDERRAVLVLPVLFAMGCGSLMWWHLDTFGGVLGWRRLGDLGSDPLRILSIFLGLHLDQAQGMFFQQPLLLPGLIGLGHMVYRRHPLTVPWLLLYGSLIMPNSMGAELVRRQRTRGTIRLVRNVAVDDSNGHLAEGPAVDD